MSWPKWPPNASKVIQSGPKLAHDVAPKPYIGNWLGAGSNTPEHLLNLISLVGALNLRIDETKVDWSAKHQTGLWWPADRSRDVNVECVNVLR
jgi:hypothetical protein